MTLKLALCLAALAVAAAAQDAVPVEQEPFHQTVLDNEHVRVFLVEVPAGKSTLLHRHTRDYMAVILGDARITNLMSGDRPAALALKKGEVSPLKGGFVHAVHNDGATPFRNVAVEFKHPQGASTKPQQPGWKYCNKGSKTACVEETYLFCSEHVCVSDVTMGVGAVTLKHRHSTDHMLIAVSAFRLSDAVEGQGTVRREEKSGDVVYLAKGINHQITNSGKRPARFIVVVWR